jgi:hypothetical protein
MRRISSRACRRAALVAVEAEDPGLGRVLDARLAKLAEPLEGHLDHPRAVPGAISSRPVRAEGVDDDDLGRPGHALQGRRRSSAPRSFERMNTDTGGLDAMAGLSRVASELSRGRASDLIEVAARAPRAHERRLGGARAQDEGAKEGRGEEPRELERRCPRARREEPGGERPAARSARTRSTTRERAESKAWRRA